MDNFKAVYIILAALEKAMDYPEFDLAVISPEALQISKERWSRYIEMMADVGYIKGVRISRDVLGNTTVMTTPWQKTSFLFSKQNVSTATSPKHLNKPIA